MANFPQAPLAADLGGGTQQDALQWRRALVEEARSWIGTPYVVGNPVKQAGCDCGSLVLGVLQSCGLARGEDLGVYSADCWAHWSEEKYLFRVMKHARKMAETVATQAAAAAPGSIVLARVVGARVYNHAGIVTEWPMVIHAITPAVIEVDASRDPLWIHREISIFEPLIPQARLAGDLGGPSQPHAAEAAAVGCALKS